jgi:hypothetical protein
MGLELGTAALISGILSAGTQAVTAELGGAATGKTLLGE